MNSPLKFPVRVAGKDLGFAENACEAMAVLLSGVPAAVHGFVDSIDLTRFGASKFWSPVVAADFWSLLPE